jgi:hypothetical protein
VFSVTLAVSDCVAPYESMRACSESNNGRRNMVFSESARDAFAGRRVEWGLERNIQFVDGPVDPWVSSLPSSNIYTIDIVVHHHGNVYMYMHSSMCACVRCIIRGTRRVK